MKRIVIGVILLGCMVFSNTLSAQVLSPQDDGIIPDAPKHYHHNQVFPYPHLREADMLWSTRHWERIDLREKINHHLYYPVVPIPDRKSLFDVLMDGIMNEGTIVEVYADHRFEIPLTPEQVAGYASRVDTLRDPDDESIVLAVDTIRIRPKDVIAYEIKSDWFFDKQRGEMKNRIIGLSPVVRDPQTKEVYPLFWVWFPDARYALATNVAFNNQNYSQRLTFDQVFHIRYFNSVIYREDNVYDRKIADYKRNSPMEQLLEGQKIKENLRNYEHDLWEY
jgi:gliding motility associated protien GldN